MHRPLEQISEMLPSVYLAAHGETAWSIMGQHTGLTNLPLSERGRRDKFRLGERLKELKFANSTNPLQRAATTCESAGFGARGESDRDLVEWDHGQYEGRRTREIHAERLSWRLFRDGCPGGSPSEIDARADRVASQVARGPEQRSDLFKWTHSGSPGGAVAGPASHGRGVLSAEHGQFEDA